MKKLNPIYFVMAVMLIAGSFLVGRSFYRIYTRKPLVVEQAQPGEAQKRMAEVRTQDLGVLDTAAEKPAAEVAKSLRRIGRQSKDDAPKYVAQFINSDNTEIRAAAIEAAAALGLSDFEKEIRDAFKSNNKQIRLAVIKGLGQQPNDFSRSVVRAHWDSRPSDSQERLATLLTLQRITGDLTEKEIWQNALVKELQAFKGTERPDEWVDAFKSLPGNNGLLDVAWKVVRKAEPTEVSFRALLYLRDFAGADALKSGLGTVSIPAHRRFQLALVDLLFDHCPTGWNQVVKNIMANDPHPTVKKGLEEAELSVKCL